MAPNETRLTHVELLKKSAMLNNRIFKAVEIKTASTDLVMIKNNNKRKRNEDCLD